MVKKNTQTSGDLRIAIKVTYERVNLAMTIIRGKDVLDMDQSMFAASATDVSDPYIVAMLRSEEKKTMKVLGRTWCSSAKRENIAFLILLLRGLTLVSLTQPIALTRVTLLYPSLATIPLECYGNT